MKIMQTRQPLDPLPLPKLTNTDTTTLLRIALLESFLRQLIYLLLDEILVQNFGGVAGIGLQIFGTGQVFVEK
jgi:hypothetical protein